MGRDNLRTERRKGRANLVLNPNLSLTIGCEAPRRGVGRTDTFLFDRVTTQAVANAMSGNGIDLRALPAEAVERLSAAGVLIPKEQVARPVRFECEVGETMPRLAPRLTKPLSPSTELMLNPRACAYKPGMIDHAHLAPFEPVAQDTIWIADGPRGIGLPVRFVGRLRTIARDLLEGRLSPAAVPKELRSVLYAARLLVPASEAGRPTRAEFTKLRKELDAKGVVVIRQMLTPIQIAACRSYLRRLDAEGYLKVGDDQTPTRRWKHNDTVGLHLLRENARIVNEILPEPIRDTYCYLAVYPPRAALPVHVDRDQCKWNLSLVLDMKPERGAADAWPIYIEANGGVAELRLGLGDGVLYSGTQQRHWRDPQPANLSTTACFFHFAHKDFMGPLA